MFIKKKVFTAVKDSLTSTVVINMLSDSPNLVRAIRDRLDMGAAMAIQMISLGAEAAGRTAKFEFVCTLDKVNLPYVTPEGAADIVTAFACNAAAADESHIYRIPIKTACEAMKIKVTFSGALTNGLDVYFIGW